jgi:PAS domain-containing protein
MGLVHQTAADAAPGPEDGFAIIDRSLTVQAISKAAERMFAVDEAEIVNRPVTDLFIPADVEGDENSSRATAISNAAAGDGSTQRLFVRPATTFGVRLQVKISACGPPSAALIVATD